MRPGKPGIFFHRKCKKKRGDDRKCTETDYDILKEWEFLSLGDFILVPFRYIKQ